MANHTNKNLDFLSNEELIDILRSVLDEIDIVVSSGAHRSTTYLAISAIEGICGELLNLLRIGPSDAPRVWPKRKGKNITLDQFTLKNMLTVFENTGNLPKLDGLPGL